MSTVATSSETSKVISFLKEYRVLECSCCSGVFGFQHRMTGALYCVGGCHERAPPTPNSGMMNGFPAVLLATPFKNMSIEPSAPALQPVHNIVDKSEEPVVSAYEKPKAEAPTIQKPEVVPTRVQERTKPELPRPPELMKPKVEGPKRYLLSQMKYSDNLARGDAQVRVVFAWTPVTYTVQAEADAVAIEALQAALMEYVPTAKTIQHAPVKGEIVIDEYEGDYYRAQVMSVDGDSCDVQFIDYGDKKATKISALFPVNDVIMKSPVYGMIVNLKLKVAVPAEDFVITKAIEDLVYNETWILNVAKRATGTALEPGTDHQVRLWNLEKDNTLNEQITNIIANAAHPGMDDGVWSPLKPDEQKEIAYFMSISSHFAETKQIVEEAKRLEALEKNESYCYVFKLDNADFRYTIQDLPLIKSSLVKGEVEVKITKFKSLSSIVAVPVGPSYQEIIKGLSTNIQRWIETRNSNQLYTLQENFIPEFDEMCIVQWPPWESVSFLMEKLYGKRWKYDYVDEHQLDLDIFKEDYEKYAGKWFRAACASTTDPSKEKSSYKDEITHMMFLVDLGKTTLIPSQYVFRMPHRFMIDAQASIFLSLQLDEMTQYNNNTDEKWKYLLLPGMKVKVKCHWMFDEVNIVKLIAPSENDFQEHFRKPEVQEGIERYKSNIEERRRHRKVKKMSGMRGSYPKVMEMVLAEEAENEKRLKPLWDEYSDFSRVHPDRVFQLCLPCL